MYTKLFFFFFFLIFINILHVLLFTQVFYTLHTFIPLCEILLSWVFIQTLLIMFMMFTFCFYQMRFQ